MVLPIGVPSLIIMNTFENVPIGTSEAEEEDNTTSPVCLVVTSGASHNSDVSQSATDLSSKRDGKQAVKYKSGSANGNASNMINVGKEKFRTKQPLSKVVQSRFRTATTTLRDNSGGSNSSSSSNKSSNSGYSGPEKNALNSTMVTGTSNSGRKPIQKQKPVRLTQVTKPKATGPTSRSSKLLNVAGTVGHTSGLQQGALPQISQREACKYSVMSPMQASNAKFHSTVLDATMLSDVTGIKDCDNVFSTTMIGGLAPGSNKLDLTGAALPELPDISAIKLDGNSSRNRSGDTTVLSSVSENDLLQNSSSGNLQEVTAEEIEQEYFRVLQWAYINVCSEDAFKIQLRDAQIQMMFLEQLIGEKQLKLSDRIQMKDHLLHQQRVSETLKIQSDVLQPLIDALPACEEAETVLSRELEKSLHQVKVDNLHVPENHKKYRDQILETLGTQISLLRELESLVEPDTHQLNSIISVFDELQNKIKHIQQCEYDVHQLARLAVQEASLQIGARQVNISALNQI
nr:uncharacterized protein LOC123762577 isoform X1 [Procambarus clarkii]